LGFLLNLHHVSFDSIDLFDGVVYPIIIVIL